VISEVYATARDEGVDRIEGSPFSSPPCRWRIRTSTYLQVITGEAPGAFDALCTVRSRGRKTSFAIEKERALQERAIVLAGPILTNILPRFFIMNVPAILYDTSVVMVGNAGWDIDITDAAVSIVLFAKRAAKLISFLKVWAVDSGIESMTDLAVSIVQQGKTMLDKGMDMHDVVMLFEMQLWDESCPFW
jgi:hypothetical protein